MNWLECKISGVEKAVGTHRSQKRTMCLMFWWFFCESSLFSVSPVWAYGDGKLLYQWLRFPPLEFHETVPRRRFSILLGSVWSFKLWNSPWMGIECYIFGLVLLRPYRLYQALIYYLKALDFYKLLANTIICFN